MLPGSNWKTDAVVRLLLSVMVCIFSGSVLAAVAHFDRAGKSGAVLFYIVGGSALVCLGVALRLINSVWPVEVVFKRLALTLVLFYTALFATAWMHQAAGAARVSVVQMFIAALSFQGATVILAALFLRRHSLTWTTAFGLSNRRLVAVCAGILVAIVFLPIGRSLQQLSGLVLHHLQQLGVSADEQLAVQTLRLAHSWGQRAALGFVTIALAPLAEELLFRGILYPWVKQAGWPRLALWGTSLLFALVHLNAMTLLPLLILSVVLTLLYEHTGNLLAPMAAHSMFNGLNFFMLYLYGQ